MVSHNPPAAAAPAAAPAPVAAAMPAVGTPECGVTCPVEQCVAALAEEEAFEEASTF